MPFVRRLLVAHLASKYPRQFRLNDMRDTDEKFRADLADGIAVRLVRFRDVPLGDRTSSCVTGVLGDADDWHRVCDRTRPLEQSRRVAEHRYEGTSASFGRHTHRRAHLPERRSKPLSHARPRSNPGLKAGHGPKEIGTAIPTDTSAVSLKFPLGQR